MLYEQVANNINHFMQNKLVNDIQYYKLRTSHIITIKATRNKHVSKKEGDHFKAAHPASHLLKCCRLLSSANFCFVGWNESLRFVNAKRAKMKISHNFLRLFQEGGWMFVLKYSFIVFRRANCLYKADNMFIILYVWMTLSAIIMCCLFWAVNTYVHAGCAAKGLRNYLQEKRITVVIRRFTCRLHLPVKIYLLGKWRSESLSGRIMCVLRAKSASCREH